MIEACKVAYQTEKDIPYALKVSERTKEIIENCVLNLTGTDIWGVEKYSFENKIKYEIIDKFYEVRFCWKLRTRLLTAVFGI